MQVFDVLNALLDRLAKGLLAARSSLWPASAAVATVPVTLPARLGLDDQWAMVVRVLGDAQTCAAGIEARQRAASAQLDAAAYALQKLKEEIAPALLPVATGAYVTAPVASQAYRMPFRRREQLAA